MADEKKVEKVELTDEQASDASGGKSFTGPFGVKMKECANPNCSNKMLESYPYDICPSCMSSTF